MPGDTPPSVDTSDTPVPPRPAPPDWDDYWAHRVAEKARARVIANFAIITVTASVVVALWGIAGIRQLLETQFTQRVQQREVEAVKRIEERLAAFEADLEQRRAMVAARADEFVGQLVVNPNYRPPQVADVKVAVDLSEFVGKIIDIEAEGAVVGATVAYAVQAELRIRKNDTTAVSARGLYVNARRHDEWPGEDYEGSSVTAALEGAKKVGIYSETDWPFQQRDKPKDGTQPKYRVASYEGLRGHQLPEQNLVMPLRAGKVIMAHVIATEDFDAPDKGGVIRLSRQLRELGGMSIALVGFDPATSMFTFANSWGAGWGTRGFGKISAADLGRIISGAWTLTMT